MDQVYGTREEWLTAAIKDLGEAVFAPASVELPPVRVSVGWPGGRGPKGKVIGQCWKRSVSADQVNQLFISPVLGDAKRVLDVLAHELVHAVDDCENGHKGAFAKIAKSIGLEGKMTATVAGEELQEILAVILADLGEYPHAVLGGTADDSAEGPKKQGTRMIKVECPGCGAIVRTTRTVLDAGAPFCGGCVDDDDSPIRMVEA